MHTITDWEDQNGQESSLSQPNTSQVSSPLGDSSAPQITESTTDQGTQRLTKHVELQCFRCGKSFQRLRREHERSIARWGTREEKKFYCSNACRETGGAHNKCPQCGEWKAQHAQTCKNCYLKDKHIKVNCTFCKKEFTKVSAEIKKGLERHGGNNHFCNKDCYSQWKLSKPRESAPMTGICNTCNLPCREGKKYCGMDCYAKRKAKNESYVGEWTPKKHQVKVRDKGACAYCGRVKQRIVVHHINHDASDHRMENLVTLCEPCHNNYHHTASESVRQILRDHFTALVTG